MSRHRVPLLTLAAVMVGLVVGVWVLWPRAPATAITRDNAAKIVAGMTVAEVEALLGGPARDEAPETTRPGLMIQSVRPELEWSSDEVSVWVHLDQDHRVRESRTIQAPPSQGAVAVLRRWLGL